MKMKRVIMSMVLIFAWAVLVQAEEFTFQQGVDHGLGVYEGSQDVTIYDNDLAIAPSAGTLRIGALYPSGIEVYNTLIRFEGLEDVLGGLVIQDAELELTFGVINNQQYMEAKIDTFTAGKMWDDPNANWDEANGGLPWELAGAQGDTDRLNLHSTTNMGPRDASTKYEDGQKFIYKLDPNEVMAWIDNPSANTGILMAMHPGSKTWTVFYSNESTAEEGTYRPLLRVTAFACLPIPGDINFDCYVNTLDLKQMVDEWLETENLTADLAGEVIVNLEDFAVLSRNWLECSLPGDPSCDWVGP
jgi:hypothetical protein